jgi:hypothetical protein
MPTRTGKDSKGCYAQWGSGKKYYYTCGNDAAKKRAVAKANKQGAAAHASGYKENQMEKVICNFTGLVRHDSMEGRDYVVAPMVMIVEGVLSGSQGPLYYPAEELGKTPEVWNHKPVTVYHPRKNDGTGASACTPEILTTYKVGVIMNTIFEEGKLKAEAWLDVDRMNVVDNRIAEAIENQQIMELSTGVFTDNEDTPGEFNGTHYDAIARNYRPDHLALLPDLTGACSVEQGAGFLRLNEFSHGTIRNLINTELRQSKPNAWIEEVYNNFFIYMDEDEKYYKLDYKETDGKIEISGSPIEVIRVVEFRNAEGQFVANLKGETMDKKTIVSNLIANEKTQWSEDDRNTLMAMDEGVLNKMVPVKNQQEEDVQEAAEQGAGETGTPSSPPNTPVETPAETPPVETPAETPPAEDETVENYLKKAPAELRPVLQNGLDMYNQAKSRFIDLIINNPKNTFTKEFLATKDNEELKNIVSLMSPTENTEQPMERFDYSGQGETQMEVNEEPLELPTVNYQKEAVTS